MSKAVDFSTPMSELLGGGGSIFNPGMYTVVESDFRMYDFKKPGNDSLCFYQKLQPLNSESEPDGDEVERYWPMNEKMRDGAIVIEPITPVKGRKGTWSQIRFTEANTHGKIYASSDFGFFLSACEKAEVDMDSIGNDITTFEGNTYEYGLFNKPVRQKSAVEEAESTGDDAKKAFPKQTVIIVSVPKKAKGGTKAKAKAKADDDDDDAPAKSTAKSAGKDKKSPKPKGPEAHVLEYLESEVCTDDNEAGVGWLDHKLNLSKWLAKKGLEPEQVKAAMKVYNDREEALPALLTTLGWSINEDKEIVKDDE